MLGLMRDYPDQNFQSKKGCFRHNFLKKDGGGTKSGFYHPREDGVILCFAHAGIEIPGLCFSELKLTCSRYMAKPK